MNIKNLLLSMLILAWMIPAPALELSLNQTRFFAGDELVLSLNEDWSGQADVYVAVTLPTADSLIFLGGSQGFSGDLTPYIQAVNAEFSREILRFQLTADLPEGTYTVFATAFKSGAFFEMFGEVVQTSFVFTREQPQAGPVELTFAEDLRFPDGVVDRVYSFEVKPETGNPPYQFSVSAGSLPAGLSLDKVSGLIQGTPSTREFGEFTIQVTDIVANVVEVQAAIKVYGVLTFGEHGTFKGCNGLQMAFNAVQDLDEIRIEQGTYDCVGTKLVENKAITHGIKISGGWDAEFKQQTIEPTLTVFDAGNQWIDSADTEELCQEANGEWHSVLKRCSQNTLISGRFLSLNNSGPIAVENFSFKNAYLDGNGGAILGQSSVVIDQCVFIYNSIYISSVGWAAERNGGAVYNVSHISNSIFSNNSTFAYTKSNYAYVYGGAASNTGNISNSTFSNNSVSASSFYRDAYVYGGAVSNTGNISNSTFSNNSAFSSGNSKAKAYGGAIFTVGDISNSTFNNNSVASSFDDTYGGAAYGADDISNSTFINNSAGDGGAISEANTIITSKFNSNIAKYGGAVDEINRISYSVFTKNTASRSGGAVNAAKYIINSLFADNTAVNGGAISGSDSTLINTTIVNNSSSKSGGGFYGSGTVLNSIFHQNTVGDEANDITPDSDGSLNLDYNLVNNLTGTYDYGTHNIMGEPHFVDAANGDYNLSANSPAINIGDNTVLEDYKFPKTSQKEFVDLNFNPRVIGGTIDFGAYERQ